MELTKARRNICLSPGSNQGPLVCETSVITNYTTQTLLFLIIIKHKEVGRIQILILLSSLNRPSSASAASSAVAMAKTKLKRRKLVKKSAADTTPKIEKKLKKQKKKTKLSKSGSDSDSDPNTKIQTLLEPFSKDQLITLVSDLSLSHASLFSLLKSAADRDISHRKIFVHGLAWDSTRQSIESVFGAYGEIEELNVVNDRNTGKCKGYAFITFKTRKSAKKLLKNPRVRVANRITSCQLASEGPAAPGAGGIVSQQHFSSSDYPQRKIYVSNVPVNASAEKLRGFFEKFGEIENGPKGLDPTTGKFKGYAIFVFKTVEGARSVLEEPYKMFEGNQLHCQKAAEGKNKVAGGSASITTALQPVQPQMLAAVAAAQQVQNMALLGQQTGMVNPLYGGGMIANTNLGALMGGYYGMMGGQIPGLGLSAYGVSGASDGGTSGAMLQGLQYMYPSGQNGQSSSSLAKASGTSGRGYSPSL
ncbi:UBP1-associated protein 2A-like [Sesamum indicum]|uniref:UBP1-associated protein 2A-like n=1 Tax=Sesamum indicum TaxID=4182 RepID=A0A6I9UGJ6_SESIN|nr:UBP1-associated protein 2A-like [Sesamum indicum]XP_020554360.1 UBP1-associated protein 2A-like [Sesamum indicum]